VDEFTVIGEITDVVSIGIGRREMKRKRYLD